MSNIPTTPALSNIVSLDQRKQHNQIAAANFDALMSTGDVSSLKGFAKEFLQNITSSLTDELGGMNAKSKTPYTFPLSAEFESTFGNSGPLPVFIDLITAKLHLSAAQNQALQQIAVKNKDITNTPANIEKIGKELKEAGIG